jgi:TetR/AcrR family transcriptional regulator
MLREQHSEELKKYNIDEKMLPQIMVSMASLSVFPFAARGVLEGIFEKIDIDFNDFIEQRKEFAAEYAIRALKKGAVKE